MGGTHARPTSRSLGDDLWAVFDGGPRFDAIVLLGLAWWTVGTFLDARSHIHQDLHTYFYFDHYVLYSGYLFTVTCILLAVFQSRRTEGRWSPPVGYGLAIAGAVLWGLGGPADLTWHSFFGFESGTETVASPTHTLMLTGGILVGTSPIRAAWKRYGAELPTRKSEFVVAATAGLVLAAFVLYTKYANPFFNPESGALNPPALGIAGILLQTGLLLGTGFVLMDRWTLRPGTFTVLFVVPMLFLAITTHDLEFLVPAVLSGVCADLLYRFCGPSTTNLPALRAFSFVVPVVLIGSYWGIVAATRLVSWSVHLWLGSILLAGMGGVLLSYVYARPETPTEEH